MATVSWLELVWTVSALAGLLYSLASLLGAWGDWRWLRMERLNGLRGIVAMANMRNEVARSLSFLLFVLIGALAMTRPQHGSQSDVLALALLSAEVLLVINSALDQRDRRRMIRAERAAHIQAGTVTIQAQNAQIVAPERSEGEL